MAHILQDEHQCFMDALQTHLLCCGAQRACKTLKLVLCEAGFCLLELCFIPLCS